MIDQNKYNQLVNNGTQVHFDQPPEPDHTVPVDRNFTIEQTGPVLIDGDWRIQWRKRPLTEQEKLSRKEKDSELARHQRDRYLSRSDMYVLPDRWESYTQQQKDSWTQFRQALRDLPSNPGWPYSVSWPQHPLGSYE